MTDIYTYNKKLQFVHSEIAEYLNQIKSDNVIIVTSGTFEYFTPEELRELFNVLKSKFKYIATAIIEPINLDLNNELSSKPRGNIA
jgi:ABC-type Zn uptake system ZnuABC Zn-binding protein ZnuA